METFSLTCNAQNLKWAGTATKTYTTSLVLSTPIGFSVSPSQGTENSTMFTLTVTKPSGSNLWCQFGYQLASGNVVIPDSQSPVYPSSSQSLFTTLGRPSGSSKQTLFANCYDSTGAYATSTASVVVTPAS